MQKTNNVQKFQVIEKILGDIDFDTKEEVLQYAEIMRNVAEDGDYDISTIDAFDMAYEEIENELSLSELKEIKKILKTQKNN